MLSHRSQTANLMSPHQQSILSLQSSQIPKQASIQVQPQLPPHLISVSSSSRAHYIPITPVEMTPAPVKKVEEPLSHQKLGALIQGYKTRRILKSHNVVSKLKTDYSDLLSFAFGLQ